MIGGGKLLCGTIIIESMLLSGDISPEGGGGIERQMRFGEWRVWQIGWQAGVT